ncbi:hypothetical protein [Caballeronia sp. DA-9]|uniref:hypothetical protein n=1 Tax=Caballeronia sp. DA-9 TaxID=3436237 RepID=UPI003F67153B
MSKAIGDATPTTDRKSGGVNQPTTITKERQPCQSSSDNQRADRPRWLSVNRTFWLTLSTAQTGASKALTSEVIDQVFGTIFQAVVSGDTVQLIGFGVTRSCKLIQQRV